MALGFRICTYNHEHKTGAVHVHDRFNHVVGSLPDMTKAQATQVARAFVHRHDWFDIERLATLAKETLHGDPD